MQFLLKWLAGLTQFDKELRHFYLNDRRVSPYQRPPLTGTAGVSPASSTVRCERFRRARASRSRRAGRPRSQEELDRLGEELERLKLTHG